MAPTIVRAKSIIFLSWLMVSKIVGFKGLGRASPNGQQTS
jgi:hypothetical protein